MLRSSWNRPLGRGIWLPLRHGLPVLVVLAVLIGQAPDSQAQESTYSFGVDIPLQFVFTGNISGAVSASGFKATLDTPYNVGVGYENYSVEANDIINNIYTTLEYKFLDVFVDMYFTALHLALGYGTGVVTTEDFTLSGTSFGFKEADASQWFLSLGWPFDPAWEFHVGYHRITAESTLLIDGVNTGATIDLGGIMHSLGLKYIF